LLDDDAIELDDPIGWEPLTRDGSWPEQSRPLMQEPLLP
jgi:hypothetical protein